MAEDLIDTHLPAAHRLVGFSVGEWFLSRPVDPTRGRSAELDLEAEGEVLVLGITFPPPLICLGYIPTLG